MITPSFNLTATERVLPKLALDFTTASLDPRVTFTRALNTATRVNSSGYVETVNADIPRFDYNPVTLACNGLLIEESRVNYQKYSSTFSSWNNYGTAPTLTSITSPTGLNDGTLFEDTGAGYFGKTINNGSFAAGTWTISLYVKQGTAASFGVWVLGSVNSFFFQDSIGWAGSPVGSGWSYSNAGNGWYRIWKSFTGTSTQTLTTYLLAAGGGTAPSGTTGFWGVQIEPGAFPTSYIPNDINGSTTRNADVATMTGTNFSSWYNASEGSFVTNITSSESSTSARVFTIHDLTINNQLFMSKAQSASYVSTFQANLVQSYNSGKCCFAYKQNSFAASVNGATPLTDTSGTLPTVSLMSIGVSWDSIAGKLNGCIKSIYYYPQRLTNAEVQAFSK